MQFDDVTFLLFSYTVQSVSTCLLHRKKNNYFKHVHDINVESQIKKKIACIDSSRRPVVMPNRTCTCII